MATPPHAAGSQYEFNAEESKVIGDLGGRLRMVAGFTHVYAALGILGMVYNVVNKQALNIDLAPLFAIPVGLWLYGAGAAFRDVATTEGRDVTHLMKALQQLRNVFRLIAILLILLVVALILLFVLAVALSATNQRLSISGYPVA